MQAVARSLGMTFEVQYAQREPLKTFEIAREMVARAPGKRPDYIVVTDDYSVADQLLKIIDAAGRVIRRSVTRYKERSLRRYSYRALLRENFISQPAVFWRRDFGRRVGPLDESLHYTMDYDLWLRMGQRSAPLILDQVLARFRLHGTSKSGQIDRRQFDEGYRVACRYVEGDWVSRLAHRTNVEKIVWAYRVMRMVGV